MNIDSLKQPAISVIMPTFNRADMLAKVLPSYLNSPFIHEVLVINDGCTDHTHEVLTKFQQEVGERVKILNHEVNKGMTFARNTGIAQAKCDLILITEDDLVLPPNSLETLVQHMDTSGADIIAGRRIWMRIGETEEEALIRANQTRLSAINLRLMEHYSHAMPANDITIPLVNATMLIKRDVIEKIQFANCFPGNAWREESDFQLRAEKLGFKIVFCPHAAYFHYDRTTAGREKSRLKSMSRYLYWIFWNNITFLRRHEDYLVRQYPQALLLRSPLLTSIFYVGYRTVLLSQTELRRAWLTRKSYITNRN